MADAEFIRLEAKIERAKEADRRARKTAAARHMRQAADILGAISHADDAMLRAVALLVEACDVLVDDEG